MPPRRDERPRRAREERPRTREPGRDGRDERTTGSCPIGADTAARLAADHVARMTGRGPEGITSLERSDDGWRIEVEVLDIARIPDSTDILAIYRAELDCDGELMGYQRIRRYARCQVEGR